MNKKLKAIILLTTTLSVNAMEEYKQNDPLDIAQKKVSQNYKFSSINEMFDALMEIGQQKSDAWFVPNDFNAQKEIVAILKRCNSFNAASNGVTYEEIRKSTKRLGDIVWDIANQERKCESYKEATPLERKFLLKAWAAYQAINVHNPDVYTHFDYVNNIGMYDDSYTSPCWRYVRGEHTKSQNKALQNILYSKEKYLDGNETLAWKFTEFLNICSVFQKKQKSTGSILESIMNFKNNWFIKAFYDLAMIGKNGENLQINNLADFEARICKKIMSSNEKYVDLILNFRNLFNDIKYKHQDNYYKLYEYIHKCTFNSNSAIAGAKIRSIYDNNNSVLDNPNAIWLRAKEICNNPIHLPTNLGCINNRMADLLHYLKSIPECYKSEIKDRAADHYKQITNEKLKNVLYYAIDNDQSMVKKSSNPLTQEAFANTQKIDQRTPHGILVQETAKKYGASPKLLSSISKIEIAKQLQYIISVSQDKPAIINFSIGWEHNATISNLLKEFLKDPSHVVTFASDNDAKFIVSASKTNDLGSTLKDLWEAKKHGEIRGHICIVGNADVESKITVQHFTEKECEEILGCASNKEDQRISREQYQQTINYRKQALIQGYDNNGKPTEGIYGFVLSNEIKSSRPHDKSTQKNHKITLEFAKFIEDNYICASGNILSKTKGFATQKHDGSSFSNAAFSGFLARMIDLKICEAGADAINYDEITESVINAIKESTDNTDTKVIVLDADLSVFYGKQSYIPYMLDPSKYGNGILNCKNAYENIFGTPERKAQIQATRAHKKQEKNEQYQSWQITQDYQGIR